MGHWEKMCKSKVVSEVRDCEEYDYHFLGSVNSTTLCSEWTVQLEIEGTPVIFKIDTGADMCIMTEEVFKTLKSEKTLLTTKTVLNSLGGRLNCISQFTAHTEFKNNRYSFKVFVIRGETPSNLLRRTVAEQMGLVKRILQCGNGGWLTKNTASEDHITRKCTALCSICCAQDPNSPHETCGGRTEQDGSRGHHRESNRAHGVPAPKKSGINVLISGS